MRKQALFECAIGLIALAVFARPSAAAEDPAPPVTVQADDAQPPCLAKTCAPCDQQPRAWTPPPHRGLLLAGYVGVNALPAKGALGSDSNGISVSVGPGLRFGGLIGLYVERRVSVNGEVTVDLLNTDDPNGYWKTGGNRYVVALSPLLHLPASSDGTIELAIGPKGGFRWTSIASQSFEVFSAHGPLFGFNGGVFLRGTAVSLGGLISFEVSRTTQACRQPDASSSYCPADLSNISAEKLVSVSGSVLF